MFVAFILDQSKTAVEAIMENLLKDLPKIEKTSLETTKCSYLQIKI